MRSVGRAAVALLSSRGGQQSSCSTFSVETPVGSPRPNAGSQRSTKDGVAGRTDRSLTAQSVAAPNAPAVPFSATAVCAFVAVAVPLVWRGAPLADDFNNCVAATGARAGWFPVGVVAAAGRDSTCEVSRDPGHRRRMPFAAVWRRDRGISPRSRSRSRGWREEYCVTSGSRLPGRTWAVPSGCCSRSAPRRACGQPRFTSRSVSRRPWPLCACIDASDLCGRGCECCRRAFDRTSDSAAARCRLGHHTSPADVAARH